MSPTSASWGVLDSNLLVKKVSGLRVVDASAFVRHLSSPKSLTDVVFSPPSQNVILKLSFIHSPKEQQLLSKKHGRRTIVTSILNVGHDGCDLDKPILETVENCAVSYGDR